jgi:hypothetical protein
MERNDPDCSPEETQRYARSLMRCAAKQLEQHLRTIKRMRAANG